VGEIRTFRDLKVWQKGVALVTDVYRVTQGFPREELFGLTSQLRRCAISVPSNIAEGYGRQATKDYIRFLQIALGSLYELLTQLEISKNLGYLDDSLAVTRALADQASEIERMLRRLLNRLKNSDHSPP
jgi:four helix bundle protein